MKKIYHMTALLTCTALTILPSCHNDKSSDHSDGVLAVDVARPVTDSVMLYRTYPGTAGARASADIVARVNGTLLTRDYTSGSLVDKGTVLFTIEPTQYNDAVMQSRASLETARSEYTYASNQAAAMKKALESDAVSKLDVIQAESNMEQSAAAIKEAEAQLNLALTNLGYCTIRAPFKGHITSSTVDPGAYISGGGSPFTLATIYDDAEVVVTFSISEPQYQQMLGIRGTPQEEIFRKVPLSFDNELAHKYTGDLYYTSPIIDKSTGTITLKCIVDNPYGELRDGMYVTVHMPFGASSHALLVKDSSIGTDQLGKYLYVVNDSNRIVYTPIETGDIYRDSLSIVTKGIGPESRYVTSAMLKVRDGMEVKPVEAR